MRRAVLRLCGPPGLKVVDAFAIAALLLVLAPTNSMRIWPIAIYGEFAVAWYFFGLALAWQAFRAVGRMALLLHGASAAGSAAPRLILRPGAPPPTPMS